MIRNISCELLDKKELITDILLKFEDNAITKGHYVVIKDKLNKYSENIDREYSTSFHTLYDNFTQQLLIGLIMTIPVTHYHKNINLKQIIDEQSYKFINFYKKNIQSFSNDSYF